LKHFISSDTLHISMWGSQVLLHDPARVKLKLPLWFCLLLAFSYPFHPLSQRLSYLGGIA
jgi:hypothetical protein